MSPYRPAHPCNWTGCQNLTHKRFCPEHAKLYERNRNRQRGSAANTLLRQKIRERDGNRCRRCGATGATARLEVHHIVPIAKGGHPTDPNNLVTLCHECHKRLQS